MKKFLIFLMIAIFALSCFSGCNQDMGVSLDGNGVYLDYATGLNADGNFNNKLYSYNQMDAVGSDPGVIYVSKEQDAEYGGYYYVYVTGGLYSHYGWNGLSGLTGYDEDVEALAVRCYRSKDLSTWSVCGSERGYSLIGRKSDWEEWTLRVPWAPEVLYNASEQKYYMFYNMPSKLYASGELKEQEGDKDSDNTQYPRDHRNYVGIATSDTPVGPFAPLSRQETVEVDGETIVQNVPCINFQAAYDLDSTFPVIDVGAFQDDDGSLYLYLKATRKGSIYGIKMLDWKTPDYNTLTCLLHKGYTEVVSGTGKAAITEDIQCSGQAGFEFIEGPHMIKYNGEYFLTVSSGDYLAQDYSVQQAKSMSPLGSFRYVDSSVGNPLLSGVSTNNFKGTGHHSFVFDGEEYFVIYHAHQSTDYYGYERFIHADRITFREVNGETVMVANGPSRSLQWLPEVAGEYSNIASKATVSVSSGTGKEYLNDGVIPYYAYNETQVLSTDTDVTVTLRFEKPVTVVSVMVFNAFNEFDAFSKIKTITFEVAAQADWMSKAYDFAVISDLMFPATYYDVSGESSDKYKNCAPAVAEFNEISVTAISFTIAKSDRLKVYDKLGNVNTQLKLTEIAVLGRA